ncbi:DUF1501 domain-containing protein [Ulvibacter antarcticus]|uniref:Putative secreted protein (Por secretion system target) n=1 Tax=Ulvibacter antarcticus TaxID=442714 RepID=A0A3L9YZN5_9FLAO|nr:DUF1501 domain-containing protein [Ulvibacter antarcticus]RMA66171.1 putative secreted protein (Por secretion system target) [Ulvibacter antarcticus]
MCNNHDIPKKNSAKSEKNIHDKEHSAWSRRSFIQALGLVGAGSMTLGRAAITASKPSPLSVALSQVDNDNILIIVRLKGGNDGLNTIVPVYDYATYANLRPTIRHQQNDLINLNADFGIPNYMNSLETVWGEGKMKVIHGVGYPQQNLSHFRSSEIWASTNEVNFEPTGWWGRYFEDLYPDYLINPPEHPPAIQIGSIGNLVFDGNDSNYSFSVANPAQLAAIAENGTVHDVLNVPDCVYGDKLLFMRSTANTTFLYSQVLNDAYMASTNNAPYEDEELSNQLAICARMIKGGLNTKVYMVTLNGFDTHANQVDDHRALLEDLADSIKNFYTDLASSGLDNKVLTMTISEFGRRPYENGSDGTDHGAASPVMLFGSGLNGSGFVGNHPDLSVWDADDNLIPTSDFRDVYSTVLTDWFCLDPSVVDLILLNQTYDNMDLGFDCNVLSTSDFSNTTRLVHAPFYQNDRTYIEISMPATANVDIRLYDILGKEIGVLANEVLFNGRHTIDVRAQINSRLAYGQYVYRIATGGQFYSKSILIK